MDISVGTGTLQLYIYVVSAPTILDRWVLVELLDTNLRRIANAWSQHSEIVFKDLAPDYYTVQVSHSLGYNRAELVEVSIGGKNDAFFGIDFYKENASNPMSEYRSHKTLQQIVVEHANHAFGPGAGFPISTWYCNHGVWLKRLPFTFQPLAGSLNFWQSTIQIRDSLHALEYTYWEPESGQVRLFTCVPPGDLKILQQRSVYVDGTVSTKKPEIATHNAIADNLGALLRDHNIASAKDFINVAQAVKLMQDKERDHTAAALGGYYLLKTGNIEHLYLEWTGNLAYWFPQMPDGLIIRAWLVLRRNNIDNEYVLTEFRDLLLQAERRGLPFYTEGLKLLFEGLSQIWKYGRSGDVEVGNAWKRVAKFIEHADKESLYTTLYNYVPIEQSNRFKRYKFSDGSNSMTEIPQLDPVL